MCGLDFCFLPVLFPRHIDAKSKDRTIDLIHTLRDYLHYHIKCSKVNLTEPNPVKRNLKPFPYNEFLDSSKLKEFADDNFEFYENVRSPSNG